MGRSSKGRAGQMEGEPVDEGVNQFPVQHGGDDVMLALSTLRAVCLDTAAPAAARASAARTILEVKALIGRHATPDEDAARKPAHAMTREEMEAELRAMRG